MTLDHNDATTDVGAPPMPPANDLTYLTTDQLAARIHYDARTIRTRLIDKALKEGIHYIRPFGGRKLLFIWERIERDMKTASVEAAKHKNSVGDLPKARVNKPDKWSPVEDSHLRDGWGEFSVQELATQLGRSKNGVQQRAQKLGLERPNAWTAAELALMHEYYESEGLASLELRLGRTRKAIQIQGRRMGLFLRPKHQEWTSKEDDLLRWCVGKMPLRQLHSIFFQPAEGQPLGHEFARSYAAVAQRVGALGISLSRQEAALLGRSE